MKEKQLITIMQKNFKFKSGDKAFVALVHTAIKRACQLHQNDELKFSVNSILLNYTSLKLKAVNHGNQSIIDKMRHESFGY